MSIRRTPLRRRLREHVADSILDAAEQIALEQGVGGMTIAAVANRAGVAVGTLYNYFSDGDAILAALFRARRATLIPLVTDAAAATRTLPFERRLHELVRLLLAAYASHERFVRVATLVDREGSKSRPRETLVRDATIAALEAVMREGARRGRISARDVATHARLLHGTLRALLLWPVSSAPLAVAGELAVETFLHGVRL